MTQIVAQHRQSDRGPKAKLRARGDRVEQPRRDVHCSHGMRVARVSGSWKGEVSKPKLLDLSQPLVERTIDDRLVLVADRDGAMERVSNSHGANLSPNLLSRMSAQSVVVRFYLFPHENLDSAQLRLQCVGRRSWARGTKRRAEGRRCSRRGSGPQRSICRAARDRDRQLRLPGSASQPKAAIGNQPLRVSRW